AAAAPYASLTTAIAPSGRSSKRVKVTTGLLEEEPLMDVGMLILRLVVGALFIGHGTQKLFGWFEGHGLEGTAGFMDSLGYRPGKRYAAIGGLAEAGGGLLLVLGLLTPLAAVLIVGMMLNAILSV